MGLWSRLFGTHTQETDAQKIARARAHLDDHEPQLAVRIVERLSGPEVDEIRARARAIVDGDDARLATVTPRDIHPSADDLARGDVVDDEQEPNGGAPYRKAGAKGRQPQKTRDTEPGDIVMQFGGDGSMKISTGGDGWLTLNAATSDDDGGARSLDGRMVAHRLIASQGGVALDPHAFAYVEACALLARSGESHGAIPDPRRRVLADLAVAAASGDPARVVSMIERAAVGTEGDLGQFAVPLAVRFAAPELAKLALRGRVRPTLTLIEALVRDDVETCVRLAAATRDDAFGFEASLIAEAAGIADARFAAPASRADQIRQLARTDLRQAIALEAEHAGDEGTDFAASLAIGRELARREPAQLLARLVEAPPHLDESGWLLAAARVPGIEEVIDRWIDALGPSTYQPFAYFASVLEVTVERGDRERTRRLLERAGPTGWQIAMAAREPLARCEDREAMLAVLYERVTSSVEPRHRDRGDAARGRSRRDAAGVARLHRAPSDRDARDRGGARYRWPAVVTRDVGRGRGGASRGGGDRRPSRRALA